MPVSKRSIYRSSALEQYGRGQEKDVSLRFASLRTRVLLWALLGVLLTLSMLSWSTQVPSYMQGTGVLLNKVSHTHRRGNTLSGGGEVHEESVVMVFLPSAHSRLLRVGLPVRLLLGSTQLRSQIAEIEPGVMSPYSACTSYAVNQNCSQVVNQPSRVAMVKLGTNVPASALSTGSSWTAEVEVGTQGMLSLLLGQGSATGE